jgi:hypothetical protein
MSKKDYGVNNPKPMILRLFCKHKYNWYRAQTTFFNLSGETQYEVCEKCGKRRGKRFVPNFDE